MGRYGACCWLSDVDSRTRHVRSLADCSPPTKDGFGWVDGGEDATWGPLRGSDTAIGGIGGRRDDSGGFCGSLGSRGGYSLRCTRCRTVAQGVSGMAGVKCGALTSRVVASVAQLLKTAADLLGCAVLASGMEDEVADVPIAFREAAEVTGLHRRARTILIQAWEVWSENASSATR